MLQSVASKADASMPAVSQSHTSDTETTILPTIRSSSSDLEKQQSPETSPTVRPASFWTQDIQHDALLETELLFLSFATGILDATTFAKYGIFATKQTGNAISLGLAALRHEKVSQNEAQITIAMGVFILGAIVFGHIGNIIGRRRRGWLIISGSCQAALIGGATAVEYCLDPEHASSAALGILSLTSFAWGGQVAMALNTGVPDLNTSVITGAITQLATDRDIFDVRNHARDRRLLFVASIVCGGFVGAVADRYVGTALGLLLTAIMKAIVVIMFLFNAGSDPGARTPSVALKETLLTVFHGA